MKMASTKSKSSHSRFKCLSTINLGGNEIRFIGVNERNNGVHFPQTVNNCPGRLLFLASDVMCSSKMSRKNFSRVITRFSKLGFAVKMRLTGFKIEGINNGGIIWFFSVQGLFHVAFDLGNMAFQKDCLSELQEVWLSRYDDPLLPVEGTLRYNKRLKVVPQDYQLSDVSWTTDFERETEARKPIGKSCRSKCIILSNERKLPGREYAVQGNTDRTHDPVIGYNCDQEYVVEETVPSDDNSFTDNMTHTAMLLDHNEADTDHNDGQQHKYLNTEQFIEKLKCFIQTHAEAASNTVAQHVILVLEYLDYFSSIEGSDSFENYGYVLFNIMKEFVMLVKVDDELPEMFENTFNMAQGKFVLMYLISDWLGLEYHKLEDVIKENVETFKKENITCIDNLPSAETIIKTLFPSFMRTFLTNWLGFYNKASILLRKSQSSISSDHCYTQNTMLSEKVVPGNINYQLIQLILEFGSNCLISGIGHVVFSRLQTENRADV